MKNTGKLFCGFIVLYSVTNLPSRRPDARGREVERVSTSSQSAGPSGFVGASVPRPRVATSCDEFSIRSASLAPQNLKLDLSFYKKYVNVSGLAVLGSSVVTDEALLVAAKIVSTMSSKRPDLHRALVQDRVRVAIMAKSEQTTDIPEQEPYSDLNWARGLGATRWSLASTGAEENLLAWKDDRYRGDNIFVHELAHTYLGMNLDAPRYLHQFKSAVTLQEAATRRFNQSRTRGLWDRTYSDTNADEWFAVGAQVWFNVIREGPAQGNGLHNAINSRVELKTYDRGLYDLLEAIFPADAVIPNACRRQVARERSYLRSSSNARQRPP